MAIPHFVPQKTASMPTHAPSGDPSLPPGFGGPAQPTTSMRKRGPPGFGGPTHPPGFSRLNPPPGFGGPTRPPGFGRQAPPPGFGAALPHGAGVDIEPPPLVRMHPVIGKLLTIQINKHALTLKNESSVAHDRWNTRQASARRFHMGQALISSHRHWCACPP